MIFHAPLALLAALFLVTIAVAGPDRALEVHTYQVDTATTQPVVLVSVAR